MTKKHILYVFDYYHPNVGGAEKLYQRIAEEMAARGHEITLITLKIKGAPKEEILNGVRVIRINSPLGRIGFGIFAIPRAIKEAKKVSIIHTSTFSGCFAAWVAGKICKIPVAITIHEIFGKMWHSVMKEPYLKAKTMELLEKIACSFSYNYYIVPSVYSYNSLRVYLGIPDEKIKLIYHGVDDKFKSSPDDKAALRKKLDLPSESFVMFFFGRTGISKGLNYLIEAFNIVKTKIPNLFFVISGSGKPVPQIADLLEKTKKQDNVRFFPGIGNEELGNYVFASDCIVVPSLAEGFGFAAAETSASGTPLVVSQVGSLPEVVSGKVAFAKPADATSISEAILDIYHKKWLLLPKKDFSWSICFDRYEQFYQEIAK